MSFKPEFLSCSARSNKTNMDVENHNGDQLRPTLASIYQAKKSGRLEDTSVEVLKQQFQSDMIKNGQQHSGGQKMNEKGLHNRSHIPSNRDREVQEIRKLEREKSFDEARSAVQSQIEKMFQLKTQAPIEIQRPIKKQHNLLTRTNSVMTGLPQPLPAKTRITNLLSVDNLEMALQRKYQLQGVSHVSHDDVTTITRNPAKNMVTLHQQFHPQFKQQQQQPYHDRGSTPVQKSGQRPNRSTSLSRRTRNVIPENSNEDLSNFEDDAFPVKARSRATLRPRSMDSLADDISPVPSTPSRRNPSRQRSQDQADKYAEYASIQRPPQMFASQAHIETLHPRQNLHRSYSQVGGSMGQSQPELSRPRRNGRSPNQKSPLSQAASVSPHRRHKHHHSLAELSQAGMMGFNFTPEARDARLKSLLGRMSPEEHLDKYLRSVQISQANNDRVSHGDESIHHRMIPNSANRENISTSGRWHSLDSISQQQLAAKIKSHQKFFLQPQNHHQHGSGNKNEKLRGHLTVGPRLQHRVAVEEEVAHRKSGISPTSLVHRLSTAMDVSQLRHSTGNDSMPSLNVNLNHVPKSRDGPRAFASMSQLDIIVGTGIHRHKTGNGHNKPVELPPKLSPKKHSPISSSPDSRVLSPDERMSTGSDPGSSPDNSDLVILRNESPIESPIPGDRVIGSEGELLSSCSCTDVTLDENNKINHHHSRRKRKVKRPVASDNDQRSEARVKIMHQPELEKDNSVQRGTRVNYLGSVSLSNRSSDFFSLQKPLKALYFKYLETILTGSVNEEPVPGTLEITKTGLKILYARDRVNPGDIQELFSPFSSIAVWAAVRFVSKKRSSFLLNNTSQPNLNQFTRSSNEMVYAFLPLISDPGDHLKSRLFSPLSKLESTKYARIPEHPSIFACIMRRRGGGLPRKLECHGFVCKSKDDAISIAAQLYQGLLDAIRRHGSRLKISRSSSVSMGSVASYDDLESGNIDTGDDSDENSRVVEEQPKPPVRTKRKSSGMMSTSGSATSETQSPNPINRPSLIISEASTEPMKDLKKEEEKISNLDSGKGSKSSHTDNSKNGEDDDEENDNSSVQSFGEDLSEENGQSRRQVTGSSGDIYTKVAMPRSRSFMNVVGAAGGQKRHYNLQELFRELKEKEGVQSIDDILRQVVSPEGMSFNQMSPMYRELLLKLVMSMSRDELFIRSKNIMDQEKQKTKPDTKAGANVSSLESSTIASSTTNVPKNNGFGSLLAFRKPFLGRKSKETNNPVENNKKKKNVIGLNVRGKPNNGSVSSRRKNSAKKRRPAKLTTADQKSVEEKPMKSKGPNETATNINNNNYNNANTTKKKLTKMDISQPIPITDKEKEKIDIVNPWKITDPTAIRIQVNNLPQAPLRPISPRKAPEDVKVPEVKPQVQLKREIDDFSECQSVCGSQCTCSVITVSKQPPPRKGVNQTETYADSRASCSTCYSYCKICGDDLNDNRDCETCYSCSSAPYSSCSTVMSQHNDSKPTKAKRANETSRTRQLEIISTDSDSSLGTLSSMDSPQTAWKRNHENVTQFDSKQHKTGIHKSGAASLGKNPLTGPSIKDRKQVHTPPEQKTVVSKSVPPSRRVYHRNPDFSDSFGDDSDPESVIEQIPQNRNNATPKFPFQKEKANNLQTSRSKTNSASAVYGFTMKGSKDKQEKFRPVETFTSKNLTLGRRLSFQQYYQNQDHGTLRSRISVDSLSSNSSSPSVKLQQGVETSSHGNETATDSLPRGRGPRPAYSDANMQHSLGYLP